MIDQSPPGRATANLDPWQPIRLTDGSTELEVIPFGATVTALRVPDRDGHLVNVVLGHQDPTGYRGGAGYFGATIGRFANRLGGGRARVGDDDYRLTTNEGVTTLHGGAEGFDQRTWSIADWTDTAVVFELVSPDGDQGFPGELAVRAAYGIEDGCIRLAYEATTDRPTVVSLTNHTYFNLSGEGSGSINDHVLTVPADALLATDQALVPTGELVQVAGGPFDLRHPTRIGDAIDGSHPLLRTAGGIDHCYLPRGRGPRQVAHVRSTQSGLSLRVDSDQPGLQVYTGNQLDGTVGGPSGQRYWRGAGLALETQAYPDAPNRPEFPSALLLPGQTYRTTTSWHFGRVDLVDAADHVEHQESQ